VINLNTKLGDLLDHREVLNEKGKLDKEAIYKHQDSMLGFAKAFSGLEDLVQGELFDEIAAVDPEIKQRRETMKYSWELLQAQMEDFFQHDDDIVDIEWVVDYYREIQNNISYTLNEAFLLLDESLAWEDRLKQRGLTVALELLSAKLTKAHQRMGNLHRPPKVKRMPKLGDIISNKGGIGYNSAVEKVSSPGESWRERIERIESNIKTRRKESGSK